MSKDKPLESVKIDLGDVRDYAMRSTENPPHMVTNWSSLSSQLNVDGLQAFRSALNSPSTPDSPEGLKELRNNHLKGLLQDLEKLSKREELNNVRFRNFPKFNPDFYNEVDKPAQQRSPEFKEYLIRCSELTASQHCVERMSALMLIEAVKPDANIGNLKANLDGYLQDYKQKYADQTVKDIGARELILLKDNSGQTRGITMEELASSKSIPLTGEQRDFIKTAWQQGSFGAGWFTASTFKFDQDNNRMTVFSQHALLIDMSETGKVQVINQAQSDWKSASDPNKRLGTCATGTLVVDITDLKGTEYVPGCASAKPKIEAVIAKYDKDFDFLPYDLKKTSSRAINSVAQDVDTEFKKGYYEAAKSDNEKVAGLALKQLPKDKPERYKAAIEKFQLKESDAAKVEQFAAEQIGNFSKEQKTVLSSEEKDRIKAGLVTILEPLCKDDRERAALENNAGKLVRDCASKAGKDMSWGQAWSSYVDKAKNIVSKLMGKQTEVEKLVGKYPNIVEALKKNMSPPTATGHKAPINQKNDEKKDTGMKR